MSHPHIRHPHARTPEPPNPELDAYNAAFEAMELDWHWDRATLRELVGPGGEVERIAGWLRKHRAHLAKAYDVEALAREIVDVRDRLRAGPSHRSGH